jgi:hypothetical protein
VFSRYGAGKRKRDCGSSFPARQSAGGGAGTASRMNSERECAQDVLAFFTYHSTHPYPLSLTHWLPTEGNVELEINQ